MKLLRPRAGIVAFMFTLSVLVVAVPTSQLASAATPPDMAAMPMAQAQATDQLPPNPGCTPDVVPIGQANPPGSQLEPLRPIWCFNLNPPGPISRVTGANDWTDNFNTATQMGRFDDGDYDYRIFKANDLSGCTTGFRTQHFTNNQHWMNDDTGAGQCGVMMRPNRSFKFEKDKDGIPTFIVEQDVAAGIAGYETETGGGITWTEIDISTGQQPGTTGFPVDTLYGYGQFNGNWTFGCRLHAFRSPICSMETANNNITRTDNTFPCYESAPARVMEISGFEVCGSKHAGFGAFSPAGNYYRFCPSDRNSPDMLCRDRFRMELRQTGFKLYVNGYLYAEDSGWDAAHQIDPAVIANGQWYVYATDWQGTTPGTQAFRYHWDNFSVNPHKADGTFTDLSTSENFVPCDGNLTDCSMVGMTPVPTNTPSSATSTPVPSTSVPPTATTQATPPPGGSSYSTSFPGTENPISEAGRWLNSVTPWTKVATTPGKAFGTAVGNETGNHESLAALNGAWGPNQAAAAKVFATGALTGTAEVSLHLRQSLVNGDTHGYEFNCSVNPNHGYMSIWSWPQSGGLRGIYFRQDAGGCKNGDVIAATAVGNTLTFYRNGTAFMQATDTAWASGGSPGIGMNLSGQTGVSGNFGLVSFAANDTGAIPTLPVGTTTPVPTATAIPATVTAVPPTGTVVPPTATPGSQLTQTMANGDHDQVTCTSGTLQVVTQTATSVVLTCN